MSLKKLILGATLAFGLGYVAGNCFEKEIEYGQAKATKFFISIDRGIADNAPGPVKGWVKSYENFVNKLYFQREPEDTEQLRTEFQTRMNKIIDDYEK